MKLNHSLKNNDQLREAVLNSVQSNHLWINAFSLVRPTDKTYIGIGRAVVEMLQTSENLLPNYYGPELDGPITELQSMTPVLYLSINQS